MRAMRDSSSNCGPPRTGFTVLEMLVVLAAIALLLAVAAPSYIQHVDTAREVALRENLRAMRDAIDKFHADQSRYPMSLGELVDRRYLRSVPPDPLTQRADSWVTLPPKAAGADGAADGAVADVRSGAVGQGRDGSTYASW